MNKFSNKGVVIFFNMTKRILDILLSSVILTAALPVIILILLTVFLLTRQFSIIVQNRFIVLESGKVRLFKIRTIKNSSEFIRQEARSNNVYQKNDFAEHVPDFCKLLRKTGLDEILQLLNVIRGEMTLVGPRPLLERDLLIIKNTEPELYNERTKIVSLPGVTGYWQVYGDRSKGTANLIAHDLYYENNKSFLLDLRIMIRTVYILFTAGHSDSILENKECKVSEPIFLSSN